MVLLDSMAPNVGGERLKDNNPKNFVTKSELEEILADFLSFLLESVKEIVHNERDKGKIKVEDKSDFRGEEQPIITNHDFVFQYHHSFEYSNQVDPTLKTQIPPPRPHIPRHPPINRTYGNEDGVHLSVVVRKLLFTPHVNTPPQRLSPFRTTCTIKGKLCTLMIDNSSSENLVLQRMVEKLQL